MKKHGITIIELAVVVAIIGIIIAIALPNFVTGLTRARRNTCINNLRQIHLAKEQWALENDKAADTVVTASDLDNGDYIQGDTASLWCPLDTTEIFANSYNINKIGEDPTCKKDLTGHAL